MYAMPQGAAGGPLIRRTRLGAGLTQQQLARRMGTTQTAIARLERPDANPRLSTLRRAIEASGARLALDAKPVPATHDLDLDQLREHLRRSPAERAVAHDRAYAETRAIVLAARHNR
ncbi:MAG: helix-turn-helix domain-containing protein [Thermoleophilaceae bacterium]